MSKKKITLLSHDFSNLKEKTVFDYTDDWGVLREILTSPNPFCDETKVYFRDFGNKKPLKENDIQDSKAPILSKSEIKHFKETRKFLHDELCLDYRILLSIIDDDNLSAALQAQFSEDEIGFGYE